METHRFSIAVLLAVLLLPPGLAAPRSTRHGRKEARYALVIAPVGDTGTHTEWLKGARFRGRNWDLAAIYYGDDPNFTCKECKVVWRGHGAKWYLLYKFLRSQKGFHHLAHKYASIMIADDDLKMSAKDLNKFFDVTIAYNLTIAQPSLCFGSYSYWFSAVGERETLLHYTNFVELMAPTFSGRFFDDVVRNTMGERVHTGWGLDYVWPYLAGWGRDNVGIVDVVCMQHVSESSRPNRMYFKTKLPMAPWKEWDANLARYNLTQEVVEGAGMKWKMPTVFGNVSRKVPMPKVNWKKRLERPPAESDSPVEDPHYGLAVFIVLLIACGGLLITGASQGRKTKLTPLRRRYSNALRE